MTLNQANLTLIPVEQLRNKIADQYGINPQCIEIVTSHERRRQLQRRYGLPNALSFTEDYLDVLLSPYRAAGLLFVDDEHLGQPIAIVLPDSKLDTA